MCAPSTPLKKGAPARIIWCKSFDTQSSRFFIHSSIHFIHFISDYPSIPLCHLEWEVSRIDQASKWFPSQALLHFSGKQSVLLQSCSLLLQVSSDCNRFMWFTTRNRGKVRSDTCRFLLWGFECFSRLLKRIKISMLSKCIHCIKMRNEQISWKDHSKLIP